MTDKAKLSEKKVQRTLTDADIVEKPVDRRSAVEKLGLQVEQGMPAMGEVEGPHTDADG